jgi:hypothetical protein
MKLPATQAEFVDWVKSNYRTVAIVLLCVLVSWQGLTLCLQMQSWHQLEKRALYLLTAGLSEGSETSSEGGQEQGMRSVEATFFYHPKPQYTLSAILDGTAVVTVKFHGREVKNQEVQVGGRIDMATVESIDSNGITIREDGSNTPKRITLHPE